VAFLDKNSDSAAMPAVYSPLKRRQFPAMAWLKQEILVWKGSKKLVKN
jgi:hypothetical protein